MNTNNPFTKWNNSRLAQMYVPDVYQQNIYNIDYNKLKEKGIKMISFDIDGTIQARLKDAVPKQAIAFFNILKKDFCIIIISNANQARIDRFANALDIHAVKKDNKAAKKPSARQFDEAKAYYKEKYGEDIEFTQMAHVGDSLSNDIAGARALEITSCLVRTIGKTPTKPTDKQLNAVLPARNLWRKHHKNEKDDQYYQFGEQQKYEENFPWNLP